MPTVATGTSLLGPNNENFKTVDFLGNGAFGEVYRAVGETSGAVVAVKLLPVGTLSSDQDKVALLNEIRVAQQLSILMLCRCSTLTKVGPLQLDHMYSWNTFQVEILRDSSEHRSNLAHRYRQHHLVGRDACSHCRE